MKTFKRIFTVVVGLMVLACAPLFAACGSSNNKSANMANYIAKAEYRNLNGINVVLSKNDAEAILGEKLSNDKDIKAADAGNIIAGVLINTINSSEIEANAAISVKADLSSLAPANTLEEEGDEGDGEGDKQGGMQAMIMGLVAQMLPISADAKIVFDGTNVAGKLVVKTEIGDATGNIWLKTIANESSTVYANYELALKEGVEIDLPEGSLKGSMKYTLDEVIAMDKAAAVKSMQDNRNAIAGAVADYVQSAKADKNGLVVITINVQKIAETIVASMGSQTEAATEESSSLNSIVDNVVKMFETNGVNIVINGGKASVVDVRFKMDDKNEISATVSVKYEKVDKTLLQVPADANTWTEMNPADDDNGNEGEKLEALAA